MSNIQIDECIVTYYNNNYFFFTEDYEFVFFMSEENTLKFFLNSEEYTNELIDSAILEDVYRHMANPLGL